MSIHIVYTFYRPLRTTTFTVDSKINYKQCCKNINNALETGICQKIHTKNIIKIIRIL